jgi:hypothetical protein
LLLLHRNRNNQVLAISAMLDVADTKRIRADVLVLDLVMAWGIPSLLLPNVLAS